MHNPLIVAVILAIVVTVLVLWNTPKQVANEKRSTTKQVFKTFIIAFIVCGIVAYVMQDNEENNMMANIIKGEPDF